MAGNFQKLSKALRGLLLTTAVCAASASPAIAAAKPCFSDDELLAAILVRNITAEVASVERCAELSGNARLNDLWGAFVDRHLGRLGRQVKLTEWAYRRNFGDDWQARFTSDRRQVWEEARKTDFGGRSPTECSASYESFFELQKQVTDEASWQSFQLVAKAQFERERRNVLSC